MQSADKPKKRREPTYELLSRTQIHRLLHDHTGRKVTGPAVSLFSFGLEYAAAELFRTMHTWEHDHNRHITTLDESAKLLAKLPCVPPNAQMQPRKDAPQKKGPPAAVRAADIELAVTTDSDLPAIFAVPVINSRRLPVMTTGIYENLSVMKRRKQRLVKTMARAEARKKAAAAAEPKKKTKKKAGAS